jgi:hypothetical protein
LPNARSEQRGGPQEHSNEEIYQKAISLLEKYFGEEGDEDENLLPNVANGGFAFGGNGPAVVGGFNFGASPIDVM